MKIKPYVFELDVFASDYDFFKNSKAGLGGRVVARSLENAMRAFELVELEDKNSFGPLRKSYCLVRQKTWISQVLILFLPKYQTLGVVRLGWVNKGDDGWSWE